MIEIGGRCIYEEYIDVDMCYDLWLDLRKWNKLAWSAPKLFDGYSSYDLRDGVPIQTLLKDVSTLIKNGYIWSGDTATAAAEKLMELYNEQVNIENEIQAIRDAVDDYCSKKSNEAQQVYLTCKGYLERDDQLRLQHKVNKAMKRGG